MRVAVITISDRASRGEHEDLSGPEIERGLRERFPAAEISRLVVPDEPDRILSALEANTNADFIITTGGTGISPRDLTPETTMRFCEKEVPGIAEALRAESCKENTFAMLSRGYAGMRGDTLVVNFPGSVNACRLGVRVLAPVMEHAMMMRRGNGH